MQPNKSGPSTHATILNSRPSGNPTPGHRNPHVPPDELPRRLIAARERERQRIAADLHDGVGQNLMLIKAEAERGVKVPEESPECLGNILRLTRDTIRELRSILRHSQSYLVTQLGLTRALEAMVRNAAAASGVEFQTSIENVDTVLDAATSLGLYRAIQECLTNVVSHSQATHASLRVCVRERQLSATIGDNGCGFDPDHHLAARTVHGCGLPDIMERMEAAGGSARILSAPGKGTMIELELPLPVNGDSPARR